jgi:catecholate siderophore receptor
MCRLPPLAQAAPLPFAALIALCAAAGPAGAQTAPGAPPEAGAIALPQIDVNAGRGGGATGYLAPRTSTAMRTDTPLVDVPQSVGIITQQAVRDLSMQNLQDALRWVPGAGFAQGEGNRDTPVLRGQSTTADLFRNGLRDDVQYYRDLYNIERVEVLLGPNAMIFGRGGAGGVVNRVTRQAGWDTVGEVRLQAGSFGMWRGTFDVGGAASDWAALRLMGMYEAGDSYRNGVNYRRSGINPTASFRIGDRTQVQIGYENFRDERTADRGIPSFQGRPLRTGTGTFFGDPDQSRSVANVNMLSAALEHRFDNGMQLNNRFLFSAVDKFYQNIFPGAVNAAGTLVSIAAYNNATQRNSILNQTDLTATLNTGPVQHRLVAGFDLGRQVTENYRNTGFFPGIGPNATSFLAPVSSPRISVPVAFRHLATDADNQSIATSAAVFLQDQIRLSPMLELVLGLRYEMFNTRFTNNNTGQRIETDDSTLSPRAALLFHPIPSMTFYASYMTSYLPRAGEQLSSLTATNASLKPESFTNYEVGAKWEVTPRLLLSAALFQLDRTNVAVTNPQDVTQLVLADGTRTRGVELSLRGQVTDRWSVMAGYASMLGEFTASQSATVPKGNTLPFLPRNTISLWNRYDILPQLGFGLGIINQSAYYASADNAVVIPGFTRVDAAAFWNVTERLTFQVNLENLNGAKYYPVAHSNNNITPGAPFAARFALTARY